MPLLIPLGIALPVLLCNDLFCRLGLTKMGNKLGNCAALPLGHLDYSISAPEILVPAFTAQKMPAPPKSSVHRSLKIQGQTRECATL